MKHRSVMMFSVLLALAGPGLGATVREIGASELRKIVKAGETLSLKSVVSSVAASAGAEPIEARAFELDGVFYRIVLKRSDGTLISVIVDAKSGQQVKSNSAVGKQVREAASKSDGKSTKGKSQTAGENGNAGGNGNSGGNANGGGGNSGGGGNGGGGGGNGGGGKG